MEGREPPPAPSTLYRAVPFEARQLAGDEVLLYSVETHAVLTCRSVVPRVLTLCRGLRPLDDHLDEIRRAGIVADDTAPHLLDALVDAGLLAPCAPPASEPQRHDADVSTVGIVTADRPHLLRRCLDSALRHADETGVRLRVAIVDGSTTPAHADENRATVRARAGSGHDVRLIGLDEAAGIRRRLRIDALGPGLTDAFTPGAIGAGRNLLLLWFAGEDLLFVDDDILATCWAPDDAGDTIEVVGHVERRHVAFFDERRDALAGLRPADASLFRAHGRVLGQPLGALTADRPAAVDWRHACGHVVGAIAARRPLTVHATFSGLAGDSAMYCPARQLFSTGAWRADVMASAAALSMAMTRREVRRIAPRLVLTHDLRCAAYCMGVHNRELPPPFMFAGRNEDGVFGALSALCRPAALFAHLPHGVVHDSERPPTYEHPFGRSATETRLSELVVACALRHAPSSAVPAPEDRLRRLATSFADLGSLDGPEFRRDATQACLDLRMRELAAIDRDLGDANVPEFWSDALHAYRETLTTHLEAPDFFVPAECRTGEPDEGFALAQQHVATFGRLLAAWPELWSNARR